MNTFHPYYRLTKTDAVEQKRVKGYAIGLVSVCLVLVACGENETPVGGISDVAPSVADTAFKGDTQLPEADASPIAREDLPRNPTILKPGQMVLRRLSAAQYRNTLRDWFGSQLELPGTLEPDVRVERLYAVGASVGGLSGLGAERYFLGAKTVATQLVTQKSLRDQLSNCTGEVDADACFSEIIDRWTLRLWRRPATDAEHARLKAVGDQARDVLGEFDEGVRYVMMAILTSPHFVYVSGVGESAADEGRAYSDFEMASRLAFFLWGSGPDEWLLDQATQGLLTDDASLPGVVDQMLQDDRVKRGVEAFVDDWLLLDELDQLSKDPGTYPHFSREFGEEAREETHRLFEYLVFTVGADIREFLTTRTTFVNRRLASTYAVPAGVPEGFGMIQLPEDGTRAGFLGHASFLSLHATPNRSSPTLRGVFVREHFLCQIMPEPPANVDTTIPESSEDKPTMRERLEEHLVNEECAGCHALTDYIGLGLERYNGLGGFRSTENGAAIDPTGDLDGVAYKNARELGVALSEHPSFIPCFVDTLWAYANGRVRTADDWGQVKALEARFRASNYQFLALMEDTVLSLGFRHVIGLEGE